MTYGPHIEARIEFIPTSAGGKNRPAYSGYRGQFYYKGADYDAVQIYLDGDIAHPGATVKAILTFLSPKLHWRNISIGMPFLIREGYKTVAFGSVTKIFDALEIDGKKSM